MSKSFSRIAIIPARGGSRRISRKNIKLINDRPAICYAIDVAKKSKLFDEIFVSSEDNEIIEIAEFYGANCSIKRKSDLADDFATTLDVISNFLENFSENSIGENTSVTCIYPVVPLLKESRLQEAQELLSLHGRGYVFPVLPSPVSPIRTFTLLDDNYINISIKSDHNLPTQNLEQYFYDAGQFYTAFASTWKSKIPILSRDSVGLKFNKWEVVDVDTEEDWSHMEQLLLLSRQRGNN